MTQRPITKGAVLLAAANLLGPDHDTVNPEYTRAIIELTADLLGIPQEYKDEMTEFIKMLAE